MSEFPTLVVKPHDVAKIMNVCGATAYKLMDVPNGIRSYRQGKLLRTSLKEVERFIDDCVEGRVSIPDIIGSNQPISTTNKICPKRLKNIQKSKAFTYEEIA